MAENTSGEVASKALFVNLVMMLTSSAMQQLGKLTDPMTNKSEINLEGARISIDMLSMLREKSSGNLDNEEEQLLNDSLASLQMNYVQTANVAKETGDKPADDGADGAPPEEPGSGPEPDGDADETASPIKGADAKTPKYHKSYGE